MIIGLAGAARSGKGTLATMLGEASGRATQRVQIAGPFKAFLRDLYDWTEEHMDGDLKDVPDTRYLICCRGCHGKGKVPVSNPKHDCSLCGTTGQVGLTPRHAMQQLGGEFAETTFPAIYATRAARAAKDHCGLALVTDCRFLRDIEAVAAVGGTIIEVRRPCVGIPGQAKRHASETERETPAFQALVDEHIDNDGTLDGLRVKAEAIIAKYQTQAEERQRIKPGDWVESKRFGPCVCIENRGDHYAVRYKARNILNQTIWMGSTDSECTLLRPADDLSKFVLTLTGPSPCGEGPTGTAAG